MEKTLVNFLCCEVWCLIGAFFLLIGYRILTGQIRTSGLLAAKGREAGISPARIQLLVFTLTGAFYYLTGVLDNPTSGELPDIPQQLLLALGGSNLFYAGSKGYGLLPRLRGDANGRKPRKRKPKKGGP